MQSHLQGQSSSQRWAIGDQQAAYPRDSKACMRTSARARVSVCTCVCVCVRVFTGVYQEQRPAASAPAPAGSCSVGATLAAASSCSSCATPASECQWRSAGGQSSGGGHCQLAAADCWADLRGRKPARVRVLALVVMVVGRAHRWALSRASQHVACMRAAFTNPPTAPLPDAFCQGGTSLATSI